MTKPSAKIVFFGSGPVAKASLDALLQFTEVEAIVTKASTLHEMTRGITDIPVHTVQNKSELTQLLATKPFESKLGIIVDFGIIVEQSVIDYFPLGIINSHFSLLPEWRGADPISFSILSGQPETGVSLMLINAALDEGQLLAQENLRIEPTDTTDTLTHKLVALSADMLKRYLPLYCDGTLKPFDQPASEATYSRKLTKADGSIDWAKTAHRLDCEIRAYQPWPKSTTQLGGMDVVITKAHVDTDIPTQSTTPQSGQLELIGKSGLRIYCGEGALIIDELKPAGAKNMTSAGFLAGHKQKLFS